MELRVILRGALSGLIAGVLAFVFAKIFAEPVINKAIAYESGRDAILDKLNKAAGRPVAPDGPEIFSRHVQSTVGLASGLIGFGVAMGAIVAVVYLVLHGRTTIRPRVMAICLAAFGFLGVFLLPFVKYPANPPAIGHSFTITTRGHLYLAMVGASIVLLALAVYLGYRLHRRFGVFYASLMAAVAFLIPYCVLIGVLPSLGDLSANVAHRGQFGYARAATETPQPITNVLSTPLVINGKTIAPGQLVYPGFDADVLWKFRWYSLLNQLLIWGASSLIFGALLERFFRTPRTPSPGQADRAAAFG
ncbi:CbtA family protein [Jatrophihabitans sp.]|uniref:CbtA family protein n=1 Tax=Jatrophihabitans sp. TaxID=1932789 RepID=UPI0030C676EA|nr:putative transrane protein [Jatrophihabitans sp.]